MESGPTVSDVYREFSKRLACVGAVVVAGGSVRDELMGRIPKDFDVFVLGTLFNDDNRDRILAAVEDMPSVEQLEFHKSEPFLVDTVRWHGADVQLMCSQLANVSELLDRFDWNVSRFAYDGTIHALTNVDEIAQGERLVLHRVTYPASTLRRGYRFSERFGMRFEAVDVIHLCREVVRQADLADAIAAARAEDE